MNVNPNFQAYISNNGAYTKQSGDHSQRVGPQEMTGTSVTEAYDGAVGATQIFSAAKDLYASSVLKTGMEGVKDDKGLGMLNDMVKSIDLNDDPAHKAARQILGHVQSALGGIPAAFGSPDTYVDRSGRFCMKIEKADSDGSYASGNAHPDSSPAMVFVDPTTQSLYIHNEPTDPLWK